MNSDKNNNNFTHHHAYAVSELRNALKRQNECVSVLIDGHSGCGKTSIVESVLKDSNNYEVLRINSSNHDNVVNLKCTLKRFTSSMSIQNLMFKSTKIIFIDDVDVLMTIDKNFTPFWSEFLRTSTSSIRVVCVANNTVVKKLAHFAQLFSVHIHLKRLTFKQCYQAVITQLPDDVHDKIDFAKLSDLVKANNNDLRTVTNNLALAYRDSKTDVGVRPAFLEMTPGEIVHYLYSRVLTHDELYEISTHDTNHIISLVHENASKYFHGQTNRCGNLKFVKQFNDIVVSYEVLSKSIFDKYDFAFWDHYTYSKMKALNRLLYNHHVKNASNNNKFLVAKNLDHSQLVNKQSLAFNFNKKLVRMERNLFLSREDVSSVVAYIMSVAMCGAPKNEIVSVLTKNEFEIVTRFVNDFLPQQKQQLLKLKNSIFK